MSVGHAAPGSAAKTAIPWRVAPPLVSTALTMIGAGQLVGQNLDVNGPELVFIAGMATTLALIPMVTIDVRAPVLPQRVRLEILKALRTSPVSVLACLLNGLLLTGCFTVGPLFGDRRFDHQRTCAAALTSGDQ